MHHDASWCIMMHHDLSWASMNYHDFRRKSGNPPKIQMNIGENYFSQTCPGSFQECSWAWKRRKRSKNTISGRKIDFSGPEIHPRWSSVLKLDEIRFPGSFRENVSFCVNFPFNEKYFNWYIGGILETCISPSLLSASRGRSLPVYWPPPLDYRAYPTDISEGRVVYLWGGWGGPSSLSRLGQTAQAPNLFQK